MNDERLMQEALNEAKKAEEQDEVPIGAVIIHDGEIIARGFNQRETTQTTLSHAELIAMERANAAVGSWRLEDCTMYVTLEPCPMCAGAMVQARMKRVVYGAFDSKAGACGTLLNLLEDDRLNHQVERTSGVMLGACSQLLKDFFRKLRG